MSNHGHHGDTAHVETDQSVRKLRVKLDPKFMQKDILLTRHQRKEQNLYNNHFTKLTRLLLVFIYFFKTIEYFTLQVPNEYLCDTVLDFRNITLNKTKLLYQCSLSPQEDQTEIEHKPKNRSP